MIIALDGPDGCGKSTLALELKKIDKFSVHLRVPGATQSPICSSLREWLLDENTPKYIHYWILQADFFRMFEELVHPNVNRLIIMERFISSTLVYQGILNKSSKEDSLAMDKQAINFFEKYYNIYFPDNMICLFYLRVSESTLKKRLKERNNKDVYDIEMEQRLQEMIEAYDVVMDKMKLISNMFPDSLKVFEINAEKPIKNLIAEISSKTHFY